MDYVEKIFNKIINKIKQIGIKKVVFIAIGILLAIIIILALGSYIENKIFENKVNNKQYSSVEDFESVREVAVYMGCKYINETEKNGKKYIYLEFNKDLYENEKSNQGFFENLSIYIANVLKFSDFTMIDGSKDIVIEVKCNKQNKEVIDMIVNGNINYFADENSKKQINKYEETKTTKLTINSTILKSLINEKWVESKVDFGTKESSFENYDIYFDEGIEVRKIGTKVFNIVFTNKHNGEIVNNLKVGESFENIEKKLGEPAFKQEDIIGYKSKNLYIFFEMDEVSVYRVETEDNEDFVNLINNMQSETDIKKIASKLTDVFSDYDEYELNGDTIRIRYSLRGIELQYNVSNKQGIVLYQNYTGKINNDKTLKDIEEKDIPKYVYLDTENNLVFLAEQLRRAQIDEIEYRSSIQKKQDESKKINTITTKFYYYLIYKQNSQVIRFISKDNSYPKTEIEDNFNSYMWLNDYKFIYSIKNQGIYSFDLKNRKTTTIIEGSDDFTFKEYSSNVLKYDEKTIKIK